MAVTGAEGLIGRRLVDRLVGDPRVSRIIALDVAEPSGSPRPKVERRRADVRDPAIASVFHGVDVVVHLAFVLDPSRDEAAMHAVNVGGTRTVLQAARDAGVRKVVYVSSATVYGAHPDNPLPITEDRPLRPNTPFNYAEHKAEIERWLWPWVEQQHDMVVTVLRPSIVAGPGVSNFISRQLDAPRFNAIRGHKPPIQFVHVDDVASALQHTIHHDLPGPYNVSSIGWLSFDEVTAIAGRKVLEVPEELAFTLADRLWKLGVGEAPAGQVPYLMHPWVVSVDALVATGWRPERSNRDALAEMAAEHADELVLGPLHTRRSRVRVVAAVTVALGTGVIAAVAHRRFWGRRRTAVSSATSDHRTG
ncbi:MAG: NAD-dependent epimerase/dehydratase family protein [Nitriliruptor sp.]|uniref:NAD-dependent epimerase/dehydratase family protein n=1 Tax=Nitriliruptor sp. TaxID=2448056 RepID=UPI0034A0799D